MHVLLIVGLALEILGLGVGSLGLARGWRLSARHHESLLPVGEDKPESVGPSAEAEPVVPSHSFFDATAAPQSEIDNQPVTRGEADRKAVYELRPAIIGLAIASLGVLLQLVASL